MAWVVTNTIVMHTVFPEELNQNVTMLVFSACLNGHPDQIQSMLVNEFSHRSKCTSMDSRST